MSGSNRNPSEFPGAAEPHDGGAVDAPFFSARLTPYRSLGPRGFLALMVAVSLVCFGAGMVFVAIGAWPVMAFFGLDVLLVYVAFRYSYGQARAFEDVHVSASDIHVIRVSHHGVAQEFHMNPAWARLSVHRVEDEGVVGLDLVSHGRALSIGSFLNPGDRESFAEALGRALSTARRGGPATLAPS
jgi:uncharacterized membrane protein